MHCQFVDCRSRPTSHSTNLHNETINYRPHSEIPLPMKSHRIFWTTASALMLLIVFIGFRKFFRGKSGCETKTFASCSFCRLNTIYSIFHH